MEPTKDLIDAIDWEKVQRARRMTFDHKFLAGPRLFDMACHVAEAGIRSQFPDADNAQVRRELQRRLVIGRQLEDQSAASSIGDNDEQ